MCIDESKLVSCLAYSDSNELVRIYSRQTKPTGNATNATNATNASNTFKSSIYHIVSWTLAECAVELVIRSSSSVGENKCRLELSINVTEENNFISTKIDKANTILEKLHKIKSSLITD